MTSKIKHPASFRDPDAFIFTSGDKICRQINQGYKEQYEMLMSSGLYTKLVKDNLLITHNEEDSINGYDENSYKVISTPTIPFISYPYEWCFGQLKEAALNTLKIQKMALDHGMILKDASAYNLQYYDGKLVFIDTSSFDIYKEGQPWLAYKQFCQHFLAPLLLMKHRGLSLNKTLEIYIDGIPLDIAASLLPLKSCLSLGACMHLFMHARSISHYSDKPQKGVAKKISKTSMFALVDNLQNFVKKLTPKQTSTEWGEYYAATNYSDKAGKHKAELVGNYIDEISPKILWDMGANTGVYSRIAADKDIFTVASDIDPVAVQTNYLQCKKDKTKNLLPIMNDLTNPSSDIGWAHEERQSLQSRGPVDMLMALALIHHLAISNNVPLVKVAEYFSKLGKSLIIEFVPKEDSQVKRLLASRKDIFNNYTKDGFEAAFSEFFTIVRQDSIKDSTRTLYLMKSNES